MYGTDVSWINTQSITIFIIINSLIRICIFSFLYFPFLQIITITLITSCPFYVYINNFISFSNYSYMSIYWSHFFICILFKRKINSTGLSYNLNSWSVAICLSVNIDLDSTKDLINLVGTIIPIVFWLIKSIFASVSILLKILSITTNLLLHLAGYS